MERTLIFVTLIAIATVASAADTRLERFVQQVKASRGDTLLERVKSGRIDVVLPLSDMKIQCDSDGRCQ